MSPFCALFVVCAVTSQELPPRQQADGEIHQPEEEKEEDWPEQQRIRCRYPVCQEVVYDSQRQECQHPDIDLPEQVVCCRSGGFCGADDADAKNHAAHCHENQPDKNGGCCLLLVPDATGGGKPDDIECRPGDGKYRCVGRLSARLRRRRLNAL